MGHWYDQVRGFLQHRGVAAVDGEWLFSGIPDASGCYRLARGEACQTGWRNAIRLMLRYASHCVWPRGWRQAAAVRGHAISTVDLPSCVPWVDQVAADEAEEERARAAEQFEDVASAAAPASSVSEQLYASLAGALPHLSTSATASVAGTEGFRTPAGSEAFRTPAQSIGTSAASEAIPTLAPLLGAAPGIPGSSKQAKYGQFHFKAKPEGAPGAMPSGSSPAEPAGASAAGDVQLQVPPAKAPRPPPPPGAPSAAARQAQQNIAAMLEGRRPIAGTAMPPTPSSGIQSTAERDIMESFGDDRTAARRVRAPTSAVAMPQMAPITEKTGVQGQGLWQASRPTTIAEPHPAGIPPPPTRAAPTDEGGPGRAAAAGRRATSQGHAWLRCRLIHRVEGGIRSRCADGFA